MLTFIAGFFCGIIALLVLGALFLLLLLGSHKRIS